MTSDVLYFGLKLAEIVTLVGIVIGPIAAVIITLWVDGRRRDREQKLTILRMLISSRHLPSDPAFQIAINLIPVEFRSSEAVISAHREFITAANIQLDGVNDNRIREGWATKSVRLIYEVAKCLGFSIRETDLQTAGYLSGGWGEREGILVDSQKAMRDVATQLMLQTRVLSGAILTPQERRYLGLPEATD